MSMLQNQFNGRVYPRTGRWFPILMYVYLSILMTVSCRHVTFSSMKSFSPSLKRTVNLYRKRTPDLLEQSSIKTFGWEERPVRVANAISWLLEHAKTEGLTPREDGYVRVQELVNITLVFVVY